MNIFLTYSRSCADQVASLADDLESLGHDVTYDRDLGGGQSWWDQILNQIRNCDIYIFLIAREALDSTACIRELKYAEALNKPALPVLVDESVSMPLIPRYLSNIQYINYSKPDEKGAVFALIKAIGNLDAAPPLPDPLPEPPAVPISYLDTLKEKVDAPNLTKQDQVILVRDLKNKLNDPQTSSKDIETLLRRLRKHQDLLASVANEIDEILRTSEHQSSKESARPSQEEKQFKQSYQPPKAHQPAQPMASAANTAFQSAATAGNENKSWSVIIMILLIGATLFIPLVGLVGGFIAYSSADKTQGKTLLIVAGVMMILYLLLFMGGGGY